MVRQSIFRIRTKPKKDGPAKIKKFLSNRKVSQPIGFFSCGSVFINPKDQFAGKLIEECGLKGLGSVVPLYQKSTRILYLMIASATDIEDLIELVRDTVYKKTGITLECEVKIIGKKSWIVL